MSYLKPLKFSTVLPRVRLVFVIAAAMMTVGILEAQTANWVEVGSGSPSSRCCMGMAYDGATHSTLLFGGVGPGPAQTLYGDTWNWHGGWLQLFPATSPSARNGAVMAFDRAVGNIVLFGGTTINNPNGTGVFFNDTWTWDGTTWTEQFPPVSPPARTGYGNMVYDAATQTVVLFGGSNIAGVAGSLNDTWTWNGVARPGPNRTPPPAPPHDLRRWHMTQLPTPSFYLVALETAAQPMAIPGLGTEPPGPNGSRQPPRPHEQNPP